jgi:glutathione S-transferase
MNLFRSEEHVARWLEEHDYEPGRTLSAGQICGLAHAWWADRLDSDWRPHTREQNQAILERLGLSGPFWLLT